MVEKGKQELESCVFCVMDSTFCRPSRPVS